MRNLLLAMDQPLSNPGEHMPRPDIEETQDSRPKARPVGSMDWFSRSVSVMSLVLSFIVLLSGGLGSYITLQNRISSLEYSSSHVATVERMDKVEYQEQLSIAERADMRSQISTMRETNQTSMEAIRLQLARIDEKLGRLAGDKRP